MGDERINRHLHRARERLENLPSRAIEQEWETTDPLLSETLTVMAHAMIAQAEINQEILWRLDAISIALINALNHISQQQNVYRKSSWW